MSNGPLIKVNKRKKSGNPYTYETTKFDNQYLNEIAGHHVDNFEHILKTRAKMLKAKDRNQARKMITLSILAGLRDCGVDVLPWMDEMDLKLLARAKGINLEFKNKPNHHEDFQYQRDFRKLGFYIYKHNEIAHFVSVPHQIKHSQTESGLIVVNQADDGNWIIWSTIHPENSTIIQPT
jgi:hypothetical protein